MRHQLTLLYLFLKELNCLEDPKFLQEKMVIAAHLGHSLGYHFFAGIFKPYSPELSKDFQDALLEITDEHLEGIRLKPKCAEVLRSVNNLETYAVDLGIPVNLWMRLLAWLCHPTQHKIHKFPNELVQEGIKALERLKSQAA